MVSKLSHQAAFKLVFIGYCFLALLSVLTQRPPLVYGVVVMLLLVVFVFYLKRLSASKFLIFFFIFSMGFSILLFLNKTGDIGAFYPVFFFVYLCCFYSYFKISSVSPKEFLACVNFSYLVYLSFSVYCYFYLQDYYRWIYLPGFEFRAFHGIEGTPANIDTFSTFVMLINALYSKSYIRYFYYMLSFFVMVIAGALTPVLIFIVVACSYAYLKIFKNFTVLLFLFLVVHFSLFYFSSNSSSFNEFLMIATNGRNIIWDSQINNMSLHSVLWSDISAATVDIHWSDGETNNPHNAFLFLVLRVGGLASFLIFLALIIKSYKSTFKNKLLIMAFLAAGISNANMLYISNPVYLYVIFFSLLYRDVLSEDVDFFDRK